MFNDREVPLRIDVPVRREVILGREVTVATVSDSGDGAMQTALDLKGAGSEFSQDSLLRMLAETEVPSRGERGYSLEDLAQNLESGSKVIAFVNAGELWDRADEPSLIEANHAVLMEGIARDAQSDEISGFFIRDPASPEKTFFADAGRVERMWLDAGGWLIVSAPVSQPL